MAKKPSKPADAVALPSDPVADCPADNQGNATDPLPSQAPIVRRCPYHPDAVLEPKVETFFIRYQCSAEGCNYFEKVPRNQISQRVAAAEQREGDYSARPQAPAADGDVPNRRLIAES